MAEAKTWRRNVVRDLVRVERSEIERLPEDQIKRIDRLEAMLQRYSSSGEFVLPKVLQEILERIGALEAAPKNITNDAEIVRLKSRIEEAEAHIEALLEKDSVEGDLAASMARVLENLSGIIKSLQTLKGRIEAIEGSNLSERVDDLEVFADRIGSAANNALLRKARP